MHAKRMYYIYMRMVLSPILLIIPIYLLHSRFYIPLTKKKREQPVAVGVRWCRGGTCRQSLGRPALSLVAPLARLAGMSLVAALARCRPRFVGIPISMHKLTSTARLDCVCMQYSLAHLPPY